VATKKPGERTFRVSSRSAIPSRRTGSGSCRGVVVTFEVVEAAVTCCCFGVEHGSGSLVSPAPSTALDRHRSGPRGVPGSAALHRRIDGCRPPWPSTHLHSARIFGWNPSRPPANRWTWIPPLVVFARLRPSAVRPHARPLPESSEEPAFGSMATNHRLAFRPRGSSPPRRFAPRERLRVCCTPLPALGFVAFRGRPSGRCSRGSPAGGGSVPRDAVRTLRRVPLVNSRAASLRPLPSCRYHSISSHRPRPVRHRYDPVQKSVAPVR
jgi:hypothetical protein